MQVTVNGEKRTYPETMTLAKLLEILAINPRAVVVERNLEIVDRSRLHLESVQDGDSVEIIRFVGGG